MTTSNFPIGLRRLLIGGGGIPAAVLFGVVMLAAGACGDSKSSSTASPAATAPATSASSTSHAAVASAMIGGLGEDSRTAPAAVVCQLRGTVPGMVFHGTLSGPNIASHSFDVTAGQPSQGRAPLAPTDGIFAVVFPGTGGTSGGGPLGPFTCTLTSVDVPNGYTLASHQPSDWTITVT